MSGHVEEFINEPHNKGIWLSVVGTFIVLSTIVYFGSMYYQASATDVLGNREETGQIGLELQQLRAYEAGMASTTAWLDKDKGVVQIPIASAMELVVKSYQN